MDLSKVKLVVTDMDGTLLNSNHQVSDLFFELFEELKKRNILFVAASGRQYKSILDKLRSIANDIIIVAENGGYVKKRDDELFATVLPKEKQLRVLSVIENMSGIHPVLCGKQSAYLTGDSGSFANLLNQYYSSSKIVKDLTKVDAEILKIAIYHYVSSEKFIYPSVKHLERDLKVKVSGPNWVDISSPDANKGFALQKLQEQYNISPAETMVFGDYNNDLEMLALADFSFAMQNAHPNVIEVANYQTSSNDEFGVERVLEQLLKS